MSYCYQIFKGPQELSARRAAVELLRVISDHRTVPWIVEFLNDSDPVIQSWGVGVLDQLFWSEMISQEEAEDLIKTAVMHQSESVRERAEWIRSFLQNRTEIKEQLRLTTVSLSPERQLIAL
jgi:hypothetical protein